MAEQSSIWKQGCFCFQAWTARLTNNLAANDLFGADATMVITSLFDSTFHTLKKKKVYLTTLANSILNVIYVSNHFIV